MWNSFNFGGNNTQRDDQLKINVGIYNPIIGKSYGEMAAESRSQHKSQGFGSAKGRGSSIEYFKFIKGDSTKTDVFSNFDNTFIQQHGTLTIPFHPFFIWLNLSLSHSLILFSPLFLTFDTNR